jgi:hypothetical protein
MACRIRPDPAFVAILAFKTTRAGESSPKGKQIPPRLVALKNAKSTTLWRRSAPSGPVDRRAKTMFIPAKRSGNAAGSEADDSRAQP